MKRKFLPLVIAAAIVTAACLGGCGKSLTEVKAKEPTCTEAGNIAYYTDGEKYFSDADGLDEITAESVAVGALGHEYSALYNWDGTEATVTLTCARDSSHTRTEAMSVTSQTTAATCADGKTIYTATATVDGKQYTDTKTVILTATEEHSLPEDYSSSATEHWKTCDSCKGEVGKTAHTFEWITDTPATQTAAGTRHEECTVCGYKRNEGTVIPPAGSGLKFVGAKDPTCKEAGNIAYYTDGTKYYSDALGKNEITQESTVRPATGNHIIANTYSSDETEHWKICSSCNDKFEKAAHSFEWITDKEPSATETGLKHEECSVCKHKRNENTVIPSTGEEKIITPVAEKAADCTNKGNIAYYTDGEKFYSDAEGLNEITDKTSVITAALGHDYGTTVTPEFTWSGFASVTAKITCKREGCGHFEQETASVTSQITVPATCVNGEKTYTATATVNGKQYTETRTEILPATEQHKPVSVYEPSETAGENGKFYRVCEVCGGDKWEVSVYGDRTVKVNGVDYNPYTCYSIEGSNLTYDAINQLFVIHIGGTVAEGLTIEANNNEVAISVDGDTQIPSITFKNFFRQLTLMGGGKLTVTGKFASEAQTTYIDCDAEFNGGVETLDHLLVIRSGNVVVNGSLKSTACNITVGTSDNAAQPTFTINSARGDGGISDGDWGRAFNLQFLSGTVNINQTSDTAANVGISCNTETSSVTVGEYATLNINGFAIGIAAWNAAVDKATLNCQGTINVTGATQGDINNMAGDYRQ